MRGRTGRPVRGSVQQAEDGGHHAVSRVSLQGCNQREAHRIRLSRRSPWPPCAERAGQKRKRAETDSGLLRGAGSPHRGPPAGRGRATDRRERTFIKEVSGAQAVVAHAWGLRETDGCWLAGLG